MLYKVIGLMSGSSLDGLDIAFVHLQETAGRWNYELVVGECYPYSIEWKNKLKNALHLNAPDYLSLHAEYGHFLGEQVNHFITVNELDHQVALISSHGHTTFHFPRKFTHQLGDGASLAAATGLPVVSDLRSLDVALGGEGAPIVPMGEKLLFADYSLLLNLGGIANLSFSGGGQYAAFDICPANRILNSLAALSGLDFDAEGILASSGTIDELLLVELNKQPYYGQAYPKSLSNDFGEQVIYPLITSYALSNANALATYTEHIAMQVYQSILTVTKNYTRPQNILITGGGAFNDFLIKRIQQWLNGVGIEIILPSAPVIKYKEAIVMALLGLLRWREETSVLSSVTGAVRDSIGGAMWMGTI